MAEQKKRATFLINSLAGGGAERVMCSLLAHSYAESEAFDTALVLLDDEPRAYDVPDWVQVHQLDCRGSTLRSVLAVGRLLTELKPDVTLSFLTRANVASILAGRAPCVISARVNTSAHFSAKGGGGSGSVVRALYPRAAKVIAVSVDVAHDLHDNFGVAEDRLTVIPNPVDIDAIQTLARAPAALALAGPYVLAAGRLVEAKNFALLIQAFALSDLAHDLVILGDGEQRPALVQLAADHGVSDRVIFAGRVDNPFPLMRGADLFASASNAEGFPNALVEAMALGAPVVATDCASGPSEILANSERGLIEAATLAPYGVLTPPNDVSEMVVALRMAAAPETRAKLARAAAERARDYDPQHIKDLYWNTLRAAAR